MLRDAALNPKSIKDMLLCPHLSLSLFLCMFPVLSADVSPIPTCYIRARKWASFFLLYSFKYLSVCIYVCLFHQNLLLNNRFLFLFVYLSTCSFLFVCVSNRFFLKFDGMLVFKILSIFWPFYFRVQQGLKIFFRSVCHLIKKCSNPPPPPSPKTATLTLKYNKCISLIAPC